MVLAMFDTERLQVFGSINNLLDKDPPFSAGSVAGVNAINVDILGRNYRMGVRAKFQALQHHQQRKGRVARRGLFVFCQGFFVGTQPLGPHKQNRHELVFGPG